MFKNLASKGSKLVALSIVPVLSFAAGPAKAAGGPDLTALSGQVDFTTTIAAVLAISGLLAGLYIAIKASKTVLGMIRGR
ncbi:hypothetical protein VA599_06040 [Chromobacterium sp. TRC.1.1.SA]|uniref:Phage-related membrane protein n=1 Tax=Chromobacterium indicum TaxID=3110228 RepID=A0ABV0CGL2_9NEIS